MNIQDLDENRTDKSLSITQSIINTACGFIPCIGTGVAEFINHFIPDSRRDRIVSVIKELAIIVESQGKDIEELKMWIENIKASKMSSLLFETALLNSIKTESKIKFHCYAYYIYSIIDNTDFEDTQKEALLQTIEKLNEYEILHIIYLGHEKYLFQESEFHKKYGHYVDRHTACGTDEDKRFNAMQDSYLNNLVVYGIATCTGDPKRGNSSFSLLPYGKLVFESLFDESFFGA